MINKIIIRIVYLTFLICTVITCRCTDNVAGGGTEDVNTRVVVGKVINPDGTAASQTQVQLIPADYDPVKNSSEIIQNDTTDISGEYRFVLKTTGKFTAQIVHLAARTRAMVSSEIVVDDTTIFPSAMLLKPGKIKVSVPANVNADNGYIYIPGSNIFVNIVKDSAFAVLDSVPAGTVSGIVYATKIESTAKVLRYNVPVKTSETAVVSNPGWVYSRNIVLNTSVTGADVVGTVTKFPVLIRLNRNNFDFSQAQNGGVDIKFTKQDNTILPIEIENWDITKKQAALWVKVDTLHGSDSTQSIVMYWGNQVESNAANSGPVFDTAAGFQGVWHMNKSGNANAIDATVNHFDAAPSPVNQPVTVDGMIGLAQRFNGVSSYFTVPGSASGKLSFPENGNYTLSAWVYTEVVDSQAHYIISKSKRNYNLDLSGYNLWEFYNIKNEVGCESNYTEPHLQQWKYLTGVRNGTGQRLYVDGICVDSTILLSTGVTIYDSTFDVQIGKRAESDYGYWNGIIDEVIISNESRNADWIRLCYMNQREDNKLVLFK